MALPDNAHKLADIYDAIVIIVLKMDFGALLFFPEILKS